MNSLKTRLAMLLFIIGLTILISLGLWQIQRGLDKEAHLDLLAARVTPKVLTALPNQQTPQQLQYQVVRLKGQWPTQQQRFFLLANRIYQGQRGYEVLTPFKLESGQWLLVNRGWIAQAQANDLPELLPDELPSGTLYQPDKGYTLGQAILPEEIAKSDWPKETLYLDIPLLSQAIKEELSPLLLVLTADHKNSFQSIWKPVVVGPARHYAYAAQWLGLAIAFSICGFIWYRKKPPHQSPTGLSG